MPTTIVEIAKLFQLSVAICCRKSFRHSHSLRLTVRPPLTEPAVNRLVAGSNPARGAKQISHLGIQASWWENWRVRWGYGCAK
jgi:hypothetical protein